MLSDAWDTAPGSQVEPGGSRPHVVLLIGNPSIAEHVETLATKHVVQGGGRVIVQVVDKPPLVAVESARAALGGCPLGFLANTEAEALDAIAAGADEAIRLPAIDLPNLLSLIDRTAARAFYRRFQEHEQESVVQAEKLVALGTIVASVAHEINNPLTALLMLLEATADELQPLCNVARDLRALAAQGSGASSTQLHTLVSMLRFSTGRSDAASMVKDATSSANTIADIVRDLLVFARGGPNESPSLIQVPDLIDQVLRIVGHQLKGQAVVERDDEPNLPPILVPRTRLALVLTNILVNASHAIRDVESSCHRIRISTRTDGEAIAISISDTGPGIPADIIPHIFDPFFTTRRETVGTGLGLAISRTTVRKLGGDLIAESVHGKGATFVVIVPVPDRHAAREAVGKTPSAIVPRSQPSRSSILLVDDDERVLRAYSRVLSDQYDLLIAADGQEAIDLLRSGSTPNIILTDLTMPIVDGVRLYEWLEAEHPELVSKVLFVCAAMTPAMSALIERTKVKCLAKPVSREVLIAAIESTRLGDESGPMNL